MNNIEVGRRGKSANNRWRPNTPFFVPLLRERLYRLSLNGNFTFQRLCPLSPRDKGNGNQPDLESEKKTRPACDFVAFSLF